MDSDKHEDYCNQHRLGQTQQHTRKGCHTRVLVRGGEAVVGGLGHTVSKVHTLARKTKVSVRETS